MSNSLTWLRHFPAAGWLTEYRFAWLPGDAVYVNADSVLTSILHRVRAASSRDIRTVICDLSASPYLDLAASRMLHELHSELVARGIARRIVGAHGRVRDLLRADGLGDKIGGLDRADTLDGFVAEPPDDHTRIGCASD